MLLFGVFIMFKFFQRSVKIAQVHTPFLLGTASVVWAGTQVNREKSKNPELTDKTRPVDCYQGPKV